MRELPRQVRACVGRSCAKRSRGRRWVPAKPSRGCGWGGTTSPGETAVHGLGDCETSATNGQEAEPGQLRDRKCQAGPAPVCPPVSAVPVLLAAEMKEA